MKRIIALSALTILLFFQCAEEKDPFFISNDTVGHLTIGMKIKQIDSIFASDSIVRLNPRQNEISTIGEVEIYEKGGKKLMLISPKGNSDPEALISNFQFYDSRYKTDKGLNSGSTFKDIKDNYTIANIETTISTVALFLEDSGIYINIDKKELPENLRYNPNFVIEAVNIPDEAKIKYFELYWDIDSLETPEKE